MHNARLNSILDAKFRANPAYSLVLFDRLPPEQQVALGDLLKDPQFYGILHPREQSGWGIKSACRDTALLYMTLQEPGGLPLYIKSMFGDQTNQAIAELVLDGVLQVEVAGTFVCGSDAASFIYGENSQVGLLRSESLEPGEPVTSMGPSSGAGTLSRLSIEALKYAQALPIDDALHLSARLYFYNRIPLTPYWQRTFSSPEAVLEHLGLGIEGPNRITFDRYWSQIAPTGQSDGWLVWSARPRVTSPVRPVTAGRPGKSEERQDRSRPTYKLYVSPQPGSLREAFGATVATFTELGVPHFKVGNDAHGLLRPDKIVSYFDRMDHLREVAETLAHRLAGVPAQGVPFTAELSGDGLLSWGIDPPGEQTLGWQARESWRLWITNRLATALLSARSSHTGDVVPWRFAMERLGLEGIDISSWTPADTIWREL